MIPDIQIDPRNEVELLEEATEYAFNRSGGLLGNLNPANPFLFLLEGQVYAGSELLWWVNRLPTKLLAQWLGYWGLTESEGSRATGEVTVQLVGVLSSPVTLPIGMLFGGNGRIFESTQSVTVPSGQVSIPVPVRDTEEGLSGNLLPYQIDSLISPTPFVKSATNPTPMVGGLDRVGSDEAIQKFVKEFQSQSCISRSDVERQVRSFLGSDDWVVRVIPNLNPDTNLSSAGTVAVLVGHRRLESVPQETLNGLNTHLQNIAPITVRMWVTEVDSVQLVISVNATYDEQDDPKMISDNIVDGISGRLAGTDSGQLSSQDLIELCHESGAEYTSGSINGTQLVNIQNARQALRVKYVEVRLAANTNREYRVPGDSRLLYGGGELNQLFIYGQGDED